MQVRVMETPKKMRPELHCHIETAQRWKVPRWKREPCTEQMRHAHRQWAAQLVRQDPANFLRKEAAVFGWSLLGLFTGLRGSEHAQAIARQHQLTQAPPIAAASDFVNTPMAFMASDFTFFDKQCCLVTHPQALLSRSCS
jgi:hypothetical protein